MEGLRSTFYALLFKSDARKQGYDEGECLSIANTMDVRPSRNRWSGEPPRPFDDRAPGRSSCLLLL